MSARTSDDRSMDGRRAIVTGGTRGLGRAIAIAFARRGARLAITYSKNDDDAEETRTLLRAAGVEPLLFKGTVASATHAKEVVTAVVTAWGGVDVLVNNAGITQVLPIALVEEADWDLVMDVNAKGAYLFSRAVLRHMIKAKSGRILAIGNFSSERLVEAPVHYAASKSALRGLVEALAREVGRYGITVNLLAPGLMNAGLARMLPQHRIDEYLAQCALGRIAETAEIAEHAAFLVSDAASFVTGAKIAVDEGGVMDLREIQRRGFDEYAEHVNPFVAQRAALAGEPIRVVRAEDGRLFDADGRAVEDLHGTQMFGHRHPAIAKALQDFLATDLPSWYPSRVSPQAGRLARMLCERTGYSAAFFSCTGSDVVEASLKLGRALMKRPGIVALEGAYHGCAVGATALMHAGPFHDPFAPHLPGVRKIPFADAGALARELERGDVGSVIVEPIQGEGGVRVLPPSFVEALCSLTARHRVLLVADEIQTGLGRTGAFLRTSAWPRRPDVVLLGKALGGGLVPLSAMLTAKQTFADAYGRDFEGGESHNVTFSYNGLAAVAGIATLELLTDDLVASVGARGARLRARFEERLTGHPLVEEVRGEGFMLGVKLRAIDHPWLGFEHFGFEEIAKEGRSTAAPLACHRLHRHGLFCFTCGHDWSVLRLQPRFTIDDATLNRLVEATREELDYLGELSS